DRQGLHHAGPRGRPLRVGFPRGAGMPVALAVRSERWPIVGAFTISRGAKTMAEVVVAELTDGTATGRGECVPYPRYGETVAGVTAAIEGLRGAIAAGLDRSSLQQA